MNTGKHYPEFVVAFASGAWGLFWMPLRSFEQQGLEASWLSIAQFAAPLVAMLPVVLWRLVNNRPIGIRQFSTGIPVGLGVALYVQSLLLTDIARALILFYAMPAWVTILELLILKLALTRWRMLSLGLSVLGMVIIINVGDGFAFTMNAGDVMALLSGMCFAFGAIQMRTTPDSVSVFEQVFVFFLYGTVAAVLLSFLPFIELGQSPSINLLLMLAPWLGLVSVGFLIPVMWGIYWASRRVDPGRLSILFQLEVIVGVGSAALFAGEPFGISQTIGTVLVICAGLVEVVGNRGD